MRRWKQLTDDPMACEAGNATTQENFVPLPRDLEQKDLAEYLAWWFGGRLENVVEFQIWCDDCHGGVFVEHARFRP